MQFFGHWSTRPRVLKAVGRVHGLVPLFSSSKKRLHSSNVLVSPHFLNVPMNETMPVPAYSVRTSGAVPEGVSSDLGC